MTALWAASQVSAASSGSASDITPGVLGFLVVAGLALALFFLLRSMNKHLSRVKSVRDAGLPPGSPLDGVRDQVLDGPPGGRGPGGRAGNGADGGDGARRG